MKTITRAKHAYTDPDALTTLDERITQNVNITKNVKPTTLHALQTQRIIKSNNLIDSRYFSQDTPIDTREADQLALTIIRAQTQINKGSQQNPIDAFYDGSGYPYIVNKDREDVTDTDADRRAIHSVSNYYNTLGVFRSDFDKGFNDLMARTAVYAMCEKAMMDYMGSVPWSILDRDMKTVEDAVHFLEYPNPQESFPTILKPTVRDVMRYDSASIVKSFSTGRGRGAHKSGKVAIAGNKSVHIKEAGYLTELKCYNGPEFWKEIDRVPMSINIPTGGNVPVQMTNSNSSHYNGWWSHGYTVRFWQRSRTGVYLPFQPEEVCYFMMYPVSDNIYGTDFLKYLRYQIQYLIDSTKAAGQTFANGVVPNMVWKHPQVRTTDQLTQRIAQMQAELKGPMKFGGAMHLVGDESIEAFDFSLHDMEWLEGQKHFEQLVWAMWGFPSSEFMGDSSTRATAYVGRNITKSRLLYPLMSMIEGMINREVLPYMQDYKLGWKFQFIKDIDLDDQQKIAHTSQIRSGTFSVLRSSGLKPSLAYKVGFLNQDLSPAELAESDETAAQMLMAGQDPMGGGGGNPDEMDQGRYGDGSESYQAVSFSDYGQGGEDTEQRMGPADEQEHARAAAKAYPYTEIYFEDDQIVKSHVYVKNRDDVPSGRSAFPGSRGGYYYNTKERKPIDRKAPGGSSTGGKQSGNAQPPEMPGDYKKLVKISGNGVALSAAEYSYGVEIRAAKNAETKKFITQIKPEMAGVPEEEQISKLKELAKKNGLIAETA
jgi:hypothetical protein